MGPQPVLSRHHTGSYVPRAHRARRQGRRPIGHRSRSATIAGATVSEFGAIILLSLFFSATKGGSASNAVSFGIFGIVVAAVGMTLGHAGRSIRLDAFLTRLQDTTAEVRVRISVALLIRFVALAAKVGLQTILGAVLAGVVLNLVDPDTASHPVFRSELDALGYGFLIPVFFIGGSATAG